MKHKKALIGVAGVGILFLLIFLYAKGEPYDFAKKWIRENQIIRETIGEVKDTTLSPSIALYVSGSSGVAKYKIGVSGQKGSGTVYLEMQKEVGAWVVTKANLILPDMTTVSLKGG